uniref:Protein kinase domain-containing protein n=1 Tax=Anopheles epiroticus TaxID=199890 RepID=A0A182P7N3_9DIPT
VHLIEYHNRANNCYESLACKLIDTKKCSEKFRKRFLPRELTILLHVRHPYIIRINSIIKCRSKICIFMRYAEMGDLLSFASDLWALGVVLYMLLNKSIPFKGKTRQVYEQQMTRAWKFRSRVNDTLSPEVKTLVRNLLEPNPLIRWTIEEVLVCDWLIQDRRLRSLNAEEFAALAEARTFARSSADIERVKEKLRRSENSDQLVTMIKETGSKLATGNHSNSLLSLRNSH